MLTLPSLLNPLQEVTTLGQPLEVSQAGPSRALSISPSVSELREMEGGMVRCAASLTVSQLSTQTGLEDADGCQQVRTLTHATTHPNSAPGFLLTLHRVPSHF